MSQVTAYEVPMTPDKSIVWDRVDGPNGSIFASPGNYNEVLDAAIDYFENGTYDLFILSKTRHGGGVYEYGSRVMKVVMPHPNIRRFGVDSLRAQVCLREGLHRTIDEDRKYIFDSTNTLGALVLSGNRFNKETGEPENPDAILLMDKVEGQNLVTSHLRRPTPEQSHARYLKALGAVGLPYKAVNLNNRTDATLLSQDPVRRGYYRPVIVTKLNVRAAMAFEF